MTRAAGIRVERSGRRPKRGVVVANHLSWADSFVMLGELGARSVAMDLYRRIPVVGQALAASSTSSGRGCVTRAPLVTALPRRSGGANW